ncbi:MAG: plasmid mobilization relaxosome protein MobC [Ruminococcus sp.]|nr:plasmid mobilization relaxosome protein MobC [Ruminococcus sp.]
MARKYKQVKRKELTFDLNDWEKIERRAEACHTDTTKYLRKMILDREPIFYDMKEIAPLLNGMRIISRNINQIAKKANETNSIYAEDIEKLQEEMNRLCHTVNLSFSTLLSTKV